MNIAISQKSIVYSAYLYLLMTNFKSHLLSIPQKFVTPSKSLGTQRNAIAIWVIVLIFIIVGGLTFAGLQWVCSHYAGGRDFRGQFKIMGNEVKVGCW